MVDDPRVTKIREAEALLCDGERVIEEAKALKAQGTKIMAQGYRMRSQAIHEAGLTFTSWKEWKNEVL